jgi:hypothetical protein
MNHDFRHGFCFVVWPNESLTYQIARVGRCHNDVGAPENRMNVLTPRDNDILPEFGPVVTAHLYLFQENQDYSFISGTIKHEKWLVKMETSSCLS